MGIGGDSISNLNMTSVPSGGEKNFTVSGLHVSELRVEKYVRAMLAENALESFSSLVAGSAHMCMAVYRKAIISKRSFTSRMRSCLKEMHALELHGLVVFLDDPLGALGIVVNCFECRLYGKGLVRDYNLKLLHM